MFPKIGVGSPNQDFVNRDFHSQPSIFEFSPYFWNNPYIPIGSMYGIFAYIYHKNQPNVGKYRAKYTIYGSYGIHIYIYRGKLTAGAQN